jgi:hypothetical protein
MSDRRPRRRGKAAKLDAAALDKLSRPGGMVRLAGGRALPLVLPRDGDADFMDFDRAVCAAGLTHYLRPTLPDDLPAGAPASSGNAVEVREAFPGCRVRTICWFVPNEALN